MSKECHQISIQDGAGEMFSGNGIVPWHGLGTVVSGLLTANEAISAAHLDWNVKAMPITCNGRILPLPTEESTKDCVQGIVREDTGDVLGIMKGRYNPIQNRECFDFMDTLAGEGLLKYETAGALRGGKQVWMMAKYDGDLTINNDKHEQWLLLVTSHDGSYSLMVQWVTVRVVCNNTFTAALRNASNQVKIRHTNKWEDKAKEAKRILGLTQDYFAEMKTALGGLNEMKISLPEARAFAKSLFPAADEAEVPTRTQNIRNTLTTLFNKPSVGTFGQSRWDLLNAVTDYTDHVTKLRGTSSSRLESSLLGTGSDLKQRAYQILTDNKAMEKIGMEALQLN